MFKLTAVFVVLFGPVASASQHNIKRQDGVVGAVAGRNMDVGYSSTIQRIIASGTPLTASDAIIAASSAVPGTWVSQTIQGGDSTTCGSNPAISEGSKMGICAYVSPPSGSDYYMMWSCTEDSMSGEVVITETRYSDESCTSGASVQTPYVFPGGCNNGSIVTCPSSGNPYAGKNYEYEDGIYLMAYETNADCGKLRNPIMYDGRKGCNGGRYYDEESMNIYASTDCSTAVLATVYYSGIFDEETCLSMQDDDADDAEDDDVFNKLFVNENAYVMATYGTDSDECFHINSTITYKGKAYSYEDLKSGKEPECSVPHTPSSVGVVISTSCDKTVRVTDTHLMATPQGFRLAYSLKPGDVLFGGYDDSDLCTVTSIEREKSVQEYFGLNCVHSEVLASGLRASTFGDFHTLPSWYMSYVGSVFGTEASSLLGQYIAEWYLKMI